MAKIAITEAVSSGHNYGLYVCLMKEWSKCSSPVKAILEDMYNLSKVIGGNKKIKRNQHFLSNFPSQNWPNIRIDGTQQRKSLNS